MTIKFPDDFLEKPHVLADICPGAKQWIYPKEGDEQVSIIGGYRDFMGDGIKTFEMYDYRDTNPKGYLTVDKINQHFIDNPL